MKIRVISLTSSAERRDSIRKQLGKLDTPFEFSDAISPHDALRHIHHYDEREFLLNCGRAATATEIACYASHLALWERCAAGDDPFLILEDDAELDSAFLAGLLVVASQIQKRGLIRVSLPEADNSPRIDDHGRFKLHYCRRVPLLALGYAVSPGGAARLARAGRIVEEPVDKYMQRFWRHRQPVYAMHPPIVRLSHLSRASDIGERRRPRYTIASWIRRAARKVENSIARTRFNLTHNIEVVQNDRPG